MMKED